MADVVLIAMPYAALERPSIGISQIQTSLLDLGITTVCNYLTFAFADLVGILKYQALVQYTNPAELVAEYTFAGAAFPEKPPDISSFAERIFTESYGHKFVFKKYLNCESADALAAELTRIRQIACDFVKSEAVKIAKSGARIVGCTSTFEQHCASLAILRQIKAIKPSIITVIGGANCEAAMGAQAAASFPWLDFVFSGEANDSFPRLCQTLLSQKNFRSYEYPGVITSSTARLALSSKTYPLAVVKSVDTIPVPDYSDYFNALSSFRSADRVRPGVIAETSRGCWFGAVSHCTFCGLNDNSISFRSKSPDAAVNYLDSVRSKYGFSAVALTDNIVDLSYIKSVFPRLKKVDPPTHFFVETKANLKRKQVVELATNGVRWIQPGIESLNTAACRNLAKGTDCLTNLALLKFCLEEGIHVSWNMLVGAPEEEDHWYVEICNLIPLISHLQPPSGVSRVRFDRFSPYHSQQEKFKLKLRPHRSYSYVYPLTVSEQENLAYFFENSQSAKARFASPGVIESLSDAVGSWRERFNSQVKASLPVCTIMPGALRDVVVDTRLGKPIYHIVTGFNRFLLRAAREPSSLNSLLLSENFPKQKGTEKLFSEGIAWLRERALLLEESGKIFALPNYPATRPLLGNSLFPGGYIHEDFAMDFNSKANAEA